jgi:hypothetical protein
MLVNNHSLQNVQSLTAEQLRAVLAVQVRMEGLSKMNKPQLVDAVQNALLAVASPAVPTGIVI